MLGSRLPLHYKSLIACKHPIIIEDMILKLPDELILHILPALAEWDCKDALLFLLEHIKNHKPHLNNDIRLALAPINLIMFNHLESFEFLREKFGFKFKSALHKAAYLGNTESFVKLKNMFSMSGMKEKIEKSLSETDELGNPPLYYAIAAGHDETAKLIFELAPHIYKLTDLPFIALRSRHSQLVDIFMEDCLKAVENVEFFKKYETITDYLTKLLEAASQYNKNPFAHILQLIKNIQNASMQYRWVQHFMIASLRLANADVFNALTKQFKFKKIPTKQVQLMSNALIFADKNPSEMVDLLEVVISIYLPLIQEKPAYLYSIVKNLTTKEDGRDIKANLPILDRLLSSLPQETKELAKKIDNSAAEFNEKMHAKILRILNNTNQTPFTSSKTITQQLVELLKINASSDELRPLINLYKISFSKKKGSSYEYRCAALLACILGEEKLVIEWFKECISLLPVTSIIEYAEQKMAFQGLAMFGGMGMAIPRELVEVYKNNVNVFLNPHYPSFTLVFDALFFAKLKINDSFLKLSADIPITFNLPSNLQAINNAVNPINKIFMLIQVNRSVDMVINDFIDQYGVQVHVGIDGLIAEPTEDKLTDTNILLILTRIQRNTHAIIRFINGAFNAGNDISARNVEKMNAKILTLESAISQALKFTTKEPTSTLQLDPVVSDNKETEKPIKKVKKRRHKAHRQLVVDEELETMPSIAIKADDVTQEITVKESLNEITTTKTVEEKDKVETAPETNVNLKTLGHVDVAKDAMTTDVPVKKLTLKEIIKEEEIKKALNVIEKAPKEVSYLDAAKRALPPNHPARKNKELKAPSSAPSLAAQTVFFKPVQPLETSKHPVSVSHPLPTPPPVLYAEEQKNVHQIYPLPFPIYPIYLIAQSLGYPVDIAAMFVLFENDIFITGGFMRDFRTKIRGPRDRDFTVFGRSETVLSRFSQAILKGKDDYSAISLELDGNNYDFKFLPYKKTPEEKKAALRVESYGRDLTANAIYSTIIETGLLEYDFWDGEKDIINKRQQVINKEASVGRYFESPDQYFRLLYLNNYMHFIFTKEVISLIVEIKKYEPKFIKACKVKFNAISRTINTMLDCYHEWGLYKIIENNQLSTILIDSNIISKVMISLYQASFHAHLLEAIFTVGRREDPLFKPAYLIWQHLDKTSQQALSLVGIRGFGMFARACEEQHQIDQLTVARTPKL